MDSFMAWIYPNGEDGGAAAQDVGGGGLFLSEMREREAMRAKTKAVSSGLDG